MYFWVLSINPFVLMKCEAKRDPSLLLVRASTDRIKNCILSLW